MNRWTPSQAPATAKLISLPSSTKATPTDLQYTPVHAQTLALAKTPLSTTATPSSMHKQAPVRDQLIAKTPISPGQAVSRKLIQKRVKLLNAPRSKPSTSVPLPTKLFSPSTQHVQVNIDSFSVPPLKAPLHLHQITSPANLTTSRKPL